MAISKNIIKEWFRNRKKPTQEQFWAWIDSYWHKDEKISIQNINGLDALFQEVLTIQQLEAHLQDTNAHSELFNSLTEKIKKQEKEIEVLKNKPRLGLQNDITISLQPNNPFYYELSPNSRLFAIEVMGDCNLKIGSSSDSTNLGETQEAGVVQLGFIAGGTWFTSNKNVDIIPIIYKF